MDIRIRHIALTQSVSAVGSHAERGNQVKQATCSIMRYVWCCPIDVSITAVSLQPDQTSTVRHVPPEKLVQLAGAIVANTFLRFTARICIAGAAGKS